MIRRNERAIDRSNIFWSASPIGEFKCWRSRISASRLGFVKTNSFVNSLLVDLFCCCCCCWLIVLTISQNNRVIAWERKLSYQPLWGLMTQNEINVVLPRWQWSWKRRPLNLRPATIDILNHPTLTPPPLLPRLHYITVLRLLITFILKGTCPVFWYVIPHSEILYERFCLKRTGFRGDNKLSGSDVRN